METRLKKPTNYGLDFESYLPGQREAIESVIDQFNDGKDIVLLDAPTGSGKSLCAMVVAKAMNQSGLISVMTKALQEQYLRDFPFLVNIKGRNNYQCAKDESFTVDEAPCNVLDRECKIRFAACEYYLKKQEAQGAQLILSNLFYFLNEANWVGDITSGRNLLVIDEGHELENVLMSFVSVDLSYRQMAQVGVDLPELNSVEETQYWAEDVLNDVQSKFLKLRNAVIEDEDRDGIKKVLQYESAMKKLRMLSSMDEETWIIDSTHTGYTLKPLTIADYAEPFVFTHGKKILMMSATFLDKGVVARQYDLTPDDVGWVHMDCAFPKENRPINYVPIQSVTRRAKTMVPTIKAIDQVLENHPHDKGVVHTVNFDLTKSILQGTKYPRRFIFHKRAGSSHNTNSREEAVQKFVRSNEPSVLISPSMQVGLDLKDDLGRFAVVAKLPFLNLGDPQIRYRMERDPEWYDWSTAATLIQTTGRTVRSATDWSTTYITDKSFGWFAKKNKRFFPPWWKEAVVKVDNIRSAVMPPQA